MARIRDVVFDSRHPASLARFGRRCWMAMRSLRMTRRSLTGCMLRELMAGRRPDSPGRAPTWRHSTVVVRACARVQAGQEPRSSGPHVRRCGRRGGPADPAGRTRAGQAGALVDDGRSRGQRVRCDAGVTCASGGPPDRGSVPVRHKPPTPMSSERPAASRSHWGVGRPLMRHCSPVFRQN